MSSPTASQTQPSSLPGTSYINNPTTAIPSMPIPLDLNTLWVEYKSADGRVYYYNAKSRDTTWTKPDGQRVMSQEEVDKLLANPSTIQTELTSSSTASSATPAQTTVSEIGSNGANDEKTMQSNQDQTNMSDLDVKKVESTSAEDQKNPQASTAYDQATFNTAQRYGYPPGGMMPPFGMPPQAMMSMMGMMPPHLMAHMSQMMPPGFPYMPPNPQMMRYPFMMPPFMHLTPAAVQQQQQTSSTKTTSSTIVNAEFQKLRQRLIELEEKLSTAKDEAAIWCEYKNPEDRAYYYNSKTTESTWDKPTVLNELVELQTEIDSLKKNIQQAEEEAKRLEQEATAASNAAKVTDDTSRLSLLNGHTIEKMDFNDVRRMDKMDTTVGSFGPEEKRLDTEKTKQKSRPISSTPVSGTPWCVVWTGDGKAFFYNPTQHLSVWEKPEDLAGRTDVDTLLSEPPKVIDSAVLRAAVKKKLDPKLSDDEPEFKKPKADTTLATKAAKVEQTTTLISPPSTSNTNGISRIEMKKKDDEEEEEENDETRGELITNNTSSISNSISSTTDDSPSKLQPKRIAAGKDAAIEAEAQAAQQRAILPYENRIKQFREMLAEKEVSAFATWEKELNKIVFDPRYLLLTTKERKQEFDKFVKERAEEERKEKAAKLKMKKKQFQDLLKDANLSTRTTFNEFSSRYGKDERFRVIEKSRDRETWFQEYLNELKRREKEERYSSKEKLKKDFFSMLKELKLTQNSSWSDIKRTTEHDHRYKVIESSSRREDWFKEFLSKYAVENEKTESKSDAPSEDDEEEKVRQREKEKQERIDASIKKRTEEVKEQLSTYQRELEKEREQLKKEKAIENFKALLTDMVRTPDVDWKDTKKLLRKDQRWDQCKQLEREHRENLFDEHINQLQKKRKIAFHQLLNEKQDIVTLTSTWKEVKKVIKNDPRFEKFSNSDKKKEKEFDEYIKERYLDAKNEFKELLQETKNITHKSLQMINESDQHLREIETTLKNDKRYLSLDVAPEERKKVLMNYLEEIAVRGPPPPPTASEPNARRKIQ
ncbi:unnamed protein product [Didymodactylos carnosus]|uniref:Transcription elongation regulator 1 n=1 Tax=Didymodactylos carnosus TaxID=1234261 RepID=A0A813XJF9_9BILA|nr:unnamed protein product [Didymodactylos carnosus]CAF0865791.1 unnamed protein product [Didymodactylos carnosus]CAF3565620.1 unnamed protein product [Didymodactylos carnosus]CAF3653275.1 unnamed protein product [Didymodactylos carnosus]